MAAYLRGYQPGGLIRADAADLRPVVGALHNARLLSLAVTDQAAHPGARAAAGFPQRAWAANQALLDHPQTPAALNVAVQQTYQRLQAARVQQPGPGRAR